MSHSTKRASKLEHIVCARARGNSRNQCGIRFHFNPLWFVNNNNNSLMISRSHKLNHFRHFRLSIYAPFFILLDFFQFLLEFVGFSISFLIDTNKLSISFHFWYFGNYRVGTIYGARQFFSPILWKPPKVFIICCFNTPWFPFQKFLLHVIFLFFILPFRKTNFGLKRVSFFISLSFYHMWCANLNYRFVFKFLWN